MVDLVTVIISFTIGSLLTMLAYSKGLQHNYELKNNTKPTSNNPIAKIIESKQEEKGENEAKNLIDEWLNGAKE